MSALYDRFSISGGAFQYDTDGWRPNAGFEHEINNFFMQVAVTPDLNLQVEMRHRESEQGDLAFNFDPKSFNPDFLQTRDADTGRVGARFSPTPNSDLLFSYIHSDVLSEVTFVPDFPFATDFQGGPIRVAIQFTGGNGSI